MYLLIYIFNSVILFIKILIQKISFTELLFYLLYCTPIMLHKISVSIKFILNLQYRWKQRIENNFLLEVQNNFSFMSVWRNLQLQTACVILWSVMKVFHTDMIAFWMLITSSCQRQKTWFPMKAMMFIIVSTVAAEFGW